MTATKECGRVTGQGKKYTSAQKALYLYWNDWLVASGISSMNPGGYRLPIVRGAWNVSSIPSSEKEEYESCLNKYKQQAEKNSARAIIYVLTPSMDDQFQRLIVVRPGPINPVNVKIRIPVTKKWEDFENKYSTRPSSIKVNLYLNGINTGNSLTLDEEHGWTGEFTDLENKTGYTVVEENTPQGYTPSCSGSQSSGFTITNTLQTTSLTVTKKWEDDNNRDGMRPRNIRRNFM